MAGVIEETYGWKPTVLEGGSTEDGVRVYVYDNDGTNVVDQDTVSGTIAEQDLDKAIYSITGTTTVSTNDETPHIARYLKYGLIPIQREFSIAQETAFDVFMTTNGFTAVTKTTANGYTDISYNHTTDSIDITGNRTTQQVYDKGQVETDDNPQYGVVGNNYLFQIFPTADGSNYTSFYDMTIATGITLNGNGDSITFDTGKDLTLTGTGIVTDISIIGNVTYNTAPAMTDVDVSGTVTFDSNVTTTWTNCNVTTVDTVAGETVTINLSGGSTPTNNDPANITIVANPVTVKIVATTESGTSIQSVNTHIEATGVGDLPVNDTVTIVNSGTTATVTHTNHGISTGDKVVIRGASLINNLGVFSVTVTNANTYTYTMTSAPGSSPTGTITSTFVYVNGLTDVNGEIEASRVFTTSQGYTGRARKSTSSPFYKNAPLTGIISSTGDTTITALMIED